MKPCAPAREGSLYRQRPVRKAEDHDGPVFRIGTEGAHSLIEAVSFSIGVQERDVDGTPRSSPDIELDDSDL